MKTIILSFVVLFSIGGCVSATADAQATVNHSFTSPNDIPGCPIATCPPTAVTVALPAITEKIHLSLPAGAGAAANVAEIDLSASNGASLAFIQELKVEMSAPGLATITLVDSHPSGTSGSLHLFPDAIDVVPYVEAESTTFTITVTGTVPDQEVPLDAAIAINAEATYHRGL